jgi:hypothetical protein
MNACAMHVMQSFGDCVLAIGMSDEFRYGIHRLHLLLCKRYVYCRFTLCMGM